MTRVQSPESESGLTVSQDSLISALSHTEPLSKKIPPERVGVEGTYDHSGLAKRVRRAFYEQFEARELDRLQVNQRGRVVILTGNVSHQQTLTQLIEVALEIYGTTTVETQGVKIGQPTESR